jgi:hypothetical protein
VNVDEAAEGGRADPDTHIESVVHGQGQANAVNGVHVLRCGR